MTVDDCLNFLGKQRRWGKVVLRCDVAFKRPFTLSVSEWIWIGSVNACVTPDTVASR